MIPFPEAEYLWWPRLPHWSRWEAAPLKGPPTGWWSGPCTAYQNQGPASLTCSRWNDVMMQRVYIVSQEVTWLEISVLISFCKHWGHCAMGNAAEADLELKSCESHFDGLVQDCSISSALAMEILQSCTKPSIWHWLISQLTSCFEIWQRAQQWYCHVLCQIPKVDNWMRVKVITQDFSQRWVVAVFFNFTTAPRYLSQTYFEIVFIIGHISVGLTRKKPCTMGELPGLDGRHNLCSLFFYIYKASTFFVRTAKVFFCLL